MATRFNWLAGKLGADWVDMILEPFALLDQVFHHVISLDLLMQPVKIGHARPLNIQRTTNFVYFMRPVRVDFMEELFLRENP